jgi:hypothetical protein
MPIWHGAKRFLGTSLWISSSRFKCFIVPETTGPIRRDLLLKIWYPFSDCLSGRVICRPRTSSASGFSLAPNTPCTLRSDGSFRTFVGTDRMKTLRPHHTGVVEGSGGETQIRLHAFVVGPLPFLALRHTASREWTAVFRGEPCHNLSFDEPRTKSPQNSDEFDQSIPRTWIQFH